MHGDIIKQLCHITLCKTCNISQYFSNLSMNEVLVLQFRWNTSSKVEQVLSRTSFCTRITTDKIPNLQQLIFRTRNCHCFYHLILNGQQVERIRMAFLEQFYYGFLYACSQLGSYNHKLCPQLIHLLTFQKLCLDGYSYNL
ncbi:unnamed protein product [Paramecium octaurelia]|uniref:Uncharacterized protein n=1 Tax=Paramecium octaurelia TaxID=43137 RepID=A0A8S1WSV7_PAROT|nr:unnamed protein product [Paramecium octaurelia]